MDHTSSGLGFLSRAVELANENVSRGGRPFGAVVVHAGVVVAEGVNTVLLTGDPSAHAELVAIRAACQSWGEPRLDGSTVYANCEPCVMCQSLALSAGVSQMIFALAAGQAAQAGWAYTPQALRLLALWRGATSNYAGQMVLDQAWVPFETWAARNN